MGGKASQPLLLPCSMCRTRVTFSDCTLKEIDGCKVYEANNGQFYVNPAPGISNPIIFPFSNIFPLYWPLICANCARTARREQVMREQEERRQKEEQMRREEEERKRNEEQMRREEEERKQKEEQRRREEEERQKEEQRRAKEEKERREKLSERLESTYQKVKALSASERYTVNALDEKVTKRDTTVSHFDEFEKVDMPSNQELLSILSEKCSIPITALDFSHITSEQTEKLIMTLNSLLFEDWIHQCPSEEVLNHAQVLITELILVSLDIPDRVSFDHVAHSVQFTVETVSSTGRKFSESLELTQALFDTFIFLSETSTDSDLKTRAIVSKWTKRELSAEEDVLLKFHEILLDSMQGNNEGIKDFVLKVEETCYELLVTTVIQSSFEDPHSQLFKSLLGLVQTNQWAPIEAVKLLKTLTEKFEDDISVMKVLDLLNIYNISQEWQKKEGSSLIQFLDTIHSEDAYQNLENSFKSGDKSSFDFILAEMKKIENLEEDTLEKVCNIIHAVQTQLKHPQNETYEGNARESFKISGQVTDDLQQVLLILCKAVFKTQSRWPRLEQMIRWCVAALSEGEKIVIFKDDPCVLIMFAALQVLRGEQVGIVWSSSILCQQEFDQWSHFYHHIGITVDTTSNKAPKEVTQSDIVYGTVDSFVCIYLHKIFEQNKESKQGQVRTFILQEDPLYLEHELQITNTFPDNVSIQNATALLQRIVKTTTDSNTSLNQVMHFIKGIFHAFQVLLLGSKDSDMTVLTVTENISKRSISEEEKYMLKFLEILLKSFEETNVKSSTEGFVVKVEKKCFELLQETVMRMFHDEPPSETPMNTCLRLVHSDLWKPVEVINLLAGLRMKYDNVTTMKILHFVEMHRVSPGWKDKEECSLVNLIESGDTENLMEHLKMSLKLKNEKSLETVLEEILQMKNVEQGVLEKVHSIVSKVQNLIADFQRESDPSEVILKGSLNLRKEPEELQKVLFILCKEVFKIKKWWPRVTQMISWCLLALPDSGTLLELGTGEGKSCVIAMFAAMRVLMGEKVDVVSSSSVLCERDAEEWLKYYQHFDIIVDVNTNKIKDEDRKRCYKSDIVYGTVETFAADHLRQTFEQKDIRPERQFQCIIVDEVDSLLLDRGVQLTYLSSDMVSMQHLNPVLAMIWSAVSHYGLVGTEKKVFIRGPAVPFYKAVYDSLDTEELKIQEPIEILQIAEVNDLVPSGFTEDVCSSKNDKLMEKLKTVSLDSMLRFFISAEEYLPCRFIPYIQDEKGILQPTGRSSEELQDILEIPFLVLQDGLCCALYESDEILWGPIQNHLKDKLQFTPCVNNKEKLNIPGFLRGLVEKKMEMWVQNAFLAIKLKEGREYVVEGERVLPVDFKSTGIVEMNKKWGDGLQQFLEMKHQVKLSTLSTVTNYISNVTYFKKYKDQIYGTTGTLGTESDLHYLTQLYPKLSACRMPSFNNKKLIELKGEIERSPEDWIKQISTSVKNQIMSTEYRNGRAALVICESINKAKEIHKALKDQVPGELKLYTRSDSDNLAVTETPLNPGDVIVATNLAGRGTDIKISDEVNDSGGLFVVLTFLSLNARVELQAFGRTARKGKPGSAQLIVCSSHLQDSLRSAQTLQAVKETRDWWAKAKIEHIMTDDIPEVFLREELFTKYCEILNDIYSQIKDIHERKVTVAVMNEYWGLWLQIKSEEILQLKETELMQSLSVDIQNAKHQSESNESPSSSIYHYIHFANNALFERKKCAHLYKKAMDLDPSWAAIAFYSHAYCTIKEKQKNYIDNAIEDLSKAKESLGFFQEQCLVTSQLVNMSNRVSEEGNSRFEKHIFTKCEMLRFFENNIEEAIAKLSEIKGRGRDAVVEEASVFSLVPEYQTDINEELYDFYKLGLVNIFSVKEKPRFCWEGLVVFFLGIVQVVAGAILTAVTFGTLANIGMLLISEGISDCISGAEAMATGEFSWKSWAMDKGISIAISVVGFGVGKLLAKGFKASKEAIKGLGGRLKSLPCTLSKQARGGLNNVMKENMKNAMKYAGKELAEQTITYGVGKVEEKVVDEILNSIKEKSERAVMETVKHDMKTNPLRSHVDTLILSHAEDRKQISDLLKNKEHSKKLKGVFKTIAETVLHENCIGLDWQKQLSSSIFKVIERAKQDVKGIRKSILTAIQLGHMSVLCADAVAAMVNLYKEFNRKYCEELNKYYEDNKIGSNKIELSSEDEQALQVFREEVADVIAKELADVAVHIFHQKFSGHLVSIAQTQINKRVSQFTGRTVNTERTKEKLKAGQNSLYIANININAKTKKSLTEHEQQRVPSYAQKIEDPQSKGSLLDLRVLAEATGTKIVIFTEDKQDKLRKMQVLEPTTTTTSGTVELIYRPKGDQYLDGHYDVCINGRVVKVENADRSCMFHAVARGLKPGASEEQISSEAEKLRKLEAKALLDSPQHWASLIERKEWSDKIRGGDWFMAEGAAPVTRGTINEARGKTGQYKTLLKANHGLGQYLNADHQPPVNSILQAYSKNQNSTLAEAMLKVATNNKPLDSKNIDKVKRDHGRYLPAVSVRKEAHMNFPTTTSQKYRDKIAYHIANDDVESTFKMTFIGSTDKNILTGKAKMSNEDKAKQKESHLGMLEQWKSVISKREHDELKTWINDEKYFDQNDRHYKEAQSLL